MTHQLQIKTNLKFKRDEKGELYGFVTKTDNGSWRGCREDEVKKKIVLTDKHLGQSMQENVLYQVVLIPMRSDSGFIAIQAKLVQFTAKIETETRHGEYKVVVKFGNKVVTYNPQSTDNRRNNPQAIAKYLRERVDLKYSNAVAEEFINCACLLLCIYNKNNK